MGQWGQGQGCISDPGGSLPAHSPQRLRIYGSRTDEIGKYLAKRFNTKKSMGKCFRAFEATFLPIKVGGETRFKNPFALDLDTDSKEEEIRLFFEAVLLELGKKMEDTVSLIHAILEEAKESKETMEELYNKATSILDEINPALLKQAKELRSTRMTMVSEISQSLTALKDIRKFFLESDYQHEMERLERFVKICHELKELKQEGVLDAISDIAIRLAIKEELGAKK